MIHGFDAETKPLAQDELAMVEPIILGLRTKVGPERAISSGRIIKAMQNHGYKINGARLRKIIHHIRVNKLIKNLVSDSRGYYISNDRKVVRKYQQSLRERAKAILDVAESFEEKMPVPYHED